jgi:hypothetical protein
MLRLRSVCKWGGLAVAASLTMANGFAANGPAVARQNHDDQDSAAQQAPNQAWAHAPEHQPTYYDTPEDRLMRELTDDGAHDRTDTQP